MKTLAIILTTILFSAAGAAKFDWKSPMTHDFGEISQGQPITHTFKFENTGEEPLVIVSATGSCGCTVPSYTKTPIEPGETGEVKVTYDAAKAGTFHKTVTLTANTDDEQVKLFVKGEVVVAE